MKNIIIEALRKNNPIHPAFFKMNNLTPEDAYVIMNDIDETPICKMCDNEVKFRSFNKGYTEYCGRTCSNKGKRSSIELKELL